MSIDTEGSEFDILKSFDFNYYSPKIVTVEYNNDSYKKKLLVDLFDKNHYLVEFQNFSNQDLWFYKKN